MKRSMLLILLAVLVAGQPATAAVQVVTTLPAYAAIAQFLGGDRVEARAISRGDEDAHFVKPKPSFALMLKNADLFVTTGLDLELWAPTVVDKSGNRSIRDGQPGFVSASQGVPMLEIPDSASREAGDVHIYGNPHIHTSPLNAKIIAANIADGLTRVDPDGEAVYRENLAGFNRRMDVELYGERLLALLGSDVLDPLARQGKLFPFLDENEHDGRKLLGLLGGWLGRAASFRDNEIVAYHKNWVYFTTLFGLDVAGFVERKPGIPPSARHVHELLETIDQRDIKVILAASYFNQKQIQTIAERSGCRAVVVDLGPNEIDSEGYFRLIDAWISGLEQAFGG
jgi:zinc/manganese transport system substrate-binding protein